MHPGSPLPPTLDAFPALWQYQISPAEGTAAGRQQIQDLTLHPSWKSHWTRTLLQLQGHMGTQWVAEAQSGLPSLLWGGGIYQDTHTPTRVLFHLLLQQLTLLAVASWLPESQALSCGLHPPNSLQGCVHTQASLRAQIAASSGTRLTFANLKLQGP